MPMTPEGKVLASIVAAFMKARAGGLRIWWVKLHGGPMQRAGLPDLLVIVEGRPVFLEVKRHGGKPTRLQEYTIAELQGAGAVAAVVHSAEEALDAIGVAWNGFSH